MPIFLVMHNFFVFAETSIKGENYGYYKYYCTLYFDFRLAKLVHGGRVFMELFKLDFWRWGVCENTLCLGWRGWRLDAYSALRS